ncbi:MAG: shikimate dehydrogenase [Chloroflexota bacterium]
MQTPEKNIIAKTITGKTNIVGLIGWPVSHSISPPMHNAAFAELGLDWCYVPFPVRGDSTNTGSNEMVEKAVYGLVGLGIRGSNVTVPHKQAVMPFMDHLTDAAKAIGAVNTIRVEEDGTLLGDNTDGRGFIADLRDHGVDPAGKRALVLGAGGSARAVVFGLAEAGCKAVTIRNRTVSKAEELAAAMTPYFPNCAITAQTNSDSTATLVAANNEADLVINSTSLGMTPHVETMPWHEDVAFRPDQVLYDLVYNPPVTRIMQHAQTGGAQAICGLGMLVWQGAIAFELWTHQEAPAEVMRQTVETIFANK